MAMPFQQIIGLPSHAQILCGRTSCAGSATSSEKVAEILKTLREDSQIDFVTGNVFLHIFLRPPPPRLEMFQFKMCVLADADDA